MAEDASTSHGRKYIEPVPAVKSMADMALWKKSSAYYDIIGFIKTINRAVQGKKLSTKLNPSPIADKLLHIFDALNEMLDETPSTFDDWFEKMKSKSTGLLKTAVPVIFHPKLIEVNTYFIESFGNAILNEYGARHELAFIMFLCALYEIYALTERDNLFVGLKIFNAYLHFVRRLQSRYRMKSDGIHGVSSIADYQLVPFIWGSAQLSAKEPFEPNRFHEPDVINRYKNEYYFIGCIDHILQVESDSFAENSNQLWSMSSVDSWAIINSILMENYERELLENYSVIQHMLFGSILELKEISEPIAKQVLANQQVIMGAFMDQSTTIWEMISSQLVWLISLVCSGWFSNYAAYILWLAWLAWLIWLIVRICLWASKTFNRPTPPPTPKQKLGSSRLQM